MMPEDSAATAELPKVTGNEARSQELNADRTKRTPGTTRRRRLRITLRRGASWALYFGIVAMVAGFGLIAYAWLRVAGLANVALQIPYLISSAVAGLGLVLVGLGVIDAATRRRDARERSQQLGQLRELLSGIADTMEPRGGDQNRGDNGSTTGAVTQGEVS
ncbi:MAG: hypothetical protein LC808_42930 [Actinobacteria bacterium]|nr:hypothetical protein [Actinomycetota bacterium]